jgi:hypothetical protein
MVGRVGPVLCPGGMVAVAAFLVVVLPPPHCLAQLCVRRPESVHMCMHCPQPLPFVAASAGHATAIATNASALTEIASLVMVSSLSFD